MAHRSTTDPEKDKQVFRNTAVRSRQVNIAPKVSRGGIRL